MTINELYGISPEYANLTDKLTPFVEEIRHSAENNNSLHGYLRFTIEPAYLTDILAKADEEQRSLQHLMLLLAGVVGFLLTRGLNRFSRRGYRLSSATDKS
jgi:membrane protein